MKQSELTRENSVIYNQASEWRGQTFLYRAIGWGSLEKVSLMDILKVWYSEPRTIDASIMLANVLNESGRCPWIARYEIGQHFDNPFFMGGQYFKKPEFEIECTSYGLFQPMGFYLIGKYINKRDKNVFAQFDIDKQFDCFTSLIIPCIKLAQKTYAKEKLETIIRGIFAAYAGDVRQINWFAIDKKFHTWQDLESKDPKRLTKYGFTLEEIKYFASQDKM